MLLRGCEGCSNSMNLLLDHTLLWQSCTHLDRGGVGDVCVCVASACVGYHICRCVHDFPVRMYVLLCENSGVSLCARVCVCICLSLYPAVTVVL